MVRAVLGTETGIYRWHGETVEPIGLSEHGISAVHAWAGPAGEAAILAGSYGDGLFRSEDAGVTWARIDDGMTAPAFRTIMADPTTPGALLCGTEPGRIFRSGDGGQSWRELKGIRSLPGHEDWYLPYSPRAGAVRTIYSPPDSQRLLAAVEVGGLLDSHDAGETWSYLPVLGDHDIHHITGHPADPALLYASLGWASLRHEQRPPDAPLLGGVARSRDGGRSWTKFYADYTRATIIPPGRPDLVLAGPAKEVGAQGRIEVSADGGDTWQPASGGIEVPMADMVELFLPAPDGAVWAVCSGGGVLRADPADWVWRPVLPESVDLKVRSVAFLPEQ